MSSGPASLKGRKSAVTPQFEQEVGRRGRRQKHNIERNLAEKTHGEDLALPVGDATLIRYGSETVVASPDAEMLNVPDAVEAA